jgi:Protein phosphatase 2A regulatory B subunit (B56 family)
MKGIFSNVKKRVGRDSEPTPVADIGMPSNNVVEMGSSKRTPVSEVNMPKRERSSSFGSATRRPSSEHIKQDPRLRELPTLKETPAAKRDTLFQHKLQLCSVMFDHTDPGEDKRGMEMKWQTLLELKDYVNTPAGQKVCCFHCLRAKTS